MREFVLIVGTVCCFGGCTDSENSSSRSSLVVLRLSFFMFEVPKLPGRDLELERITVGFSSEALRRVHTGIRPEHCLVAASDTRFLKLWWDVLFRGQG